MNSRSLLIHILNQSLGNSLCLSERNEFYFHTLGIQYLFIFLSNPISNVSFSEEYTFRTQHSATMLKTCSVCKTTLQMVVQINGPIQRLLVTLKIMEAL